MLMCVESEWKLRFFSGIKCEAYFVTKDVLLTKYYERTNREQWEAEKQQEEAENPFGDSEDDAFGHDDDFGDFMEDDSVDDRPLDENTYEMEARNKETMEDTRPDSVDHQAPYNEDIADEQEVEDPWKSEEYVYDDNEYFTGDDQEYEEEEDDWTDGWWRKWENTEVVR